MSQGAFGNCNVRDQKFAVEIGLRFCPGLEGDEAAEEPSSEVGSAKVEAAVATGNATSSTSISMLE